MVLSYMGLNLHGIGVIVWNMHSMALLTIAECKIHFQTFTTTEARLQFSLLRTRIIYLALPWPEIYS